MTSSQAPKDWTRHPVTRFLGSLWLLLPLLVLMLLVLVGSSKWGLDESIGAIRKDIYQPAFNVLMGLLVVNLVTCTLMRRPYKVWMWGFLCTHAGVFTIMLGSWMSYNWKEYGQMRIREGENERFFELEDVRTLVVETSGDRRYEHAIEENLYRPSEPRKVWRIAEEDLTVFIDRYLPHTEFKPPKYPAFEEVPEGGRPAAEIEYFFEGQSSGTQWITEGISEGVGGLEMLVLQQMSEEKFREFTERFKDGVAVSAVFFVRLPSGWKYVFMSRRGASPEIGDYTPGTLVRYPFMPMRLEFRMNRYLPRAEKVPVPREIQKDDPDKFPALYVRLRGSSGERGGWVFWREPRTLELPGRSVRLRFTGKQRDAFGLEVRLLAFRKVDHPGTSQAQSFESDIEVIDPARGGVSFKETVKVNDPLDYRGVVFYQAQYSRDSDGRWVSIFQVSRDPGKKIVYLGVLITISGSIYMFYLRRFLMRLMQGMLGASDPPLSSAAQLGYLALGTSGTLAGFLLAGMAEWPMLAVVGAVLGLDVLGLAIMILQAQGWAAVRPARPLARPLAMLAGGAALGAGLVAWAFRLPWTGPATAAAVLAAAVAYLFYLGARPTVQARPGRAGQVGQLLACSWLLNTAGLTVLLLTQTA